MTIAHAGRLIAALRIFFAIVSLQHLPKITSVWKSRRSSRFKEVTGGHAAKPFPGGEGASRLQPGVFANTFVARLPRIARRSVAVGTGVDFLRLGSDPEVRGLLLPYDQHLAALPAFGFGAVAAA